MKNIIRFVILDILKNKIIIAYTILLATFSWTAFSLEDNSSKAILTLLNIILLIVPLVSILFSTIYIYNSAEFIELLISQPINRKIIWMSIFIGLLISFLVSYLIGIGIPLLLFAEFSIGLLMIVMGCLISMIFVAVAFLSSIITRDKAKGIGASILLWLYFALLFDGLVLFLLFQFSDYPIEKIMIGITATNPIDLSRILILLHLDVSAMMGYTGAVFKQFFGTTWGLIISFVLLFVWIVIPFWVSLSIFNRKDL